MIYFGLHESALILQVVQLLLSFALLLLTILAGKAESHRSFYVGLQALLFLSTLAATVGIFLFTEDDALDLYRAMTVRPEIILAQFWIFARSPKQDAAEEKRQSRQGAATRGVLRQEEHEALLEERARSQHEREEASAERAEAQWERRQASRERSESLEDRDESGVDRDASVEERLASSGDRDEAKIDRNEGREHRRPHADPNGGSQS